MMPSSKPPLLSVVVIGRNEGPRLQRCLQSIKDMIPLEGAVEVIYVDSGSTDGSPEAARRVGVRVIALSARRPTAAMGRNAGWRAASGRFVLFLDGDTILDHQFVAIAVTELSPETAVIFGNRRELHPQSSPYNRVLDLEWISPAGFVDSCGGDAIVRREALEAVKGYDETLIAGEEPDMCRRMRALGWRILHVDRPMTGHDLAMTRWSQYVRRAKRTGYAYAEVSERYRGTALPLWEHEVTHNRNHALFHAGMAALSLSASVLVRNLWPLAIPIVLLLLLSMRTAFKARSKTSSRLTCVLYGLHSHLQQIFIYTGQLEYWRDRRDGRTRGLMEYKETAQ